jgi:hypothetical protein
MDHLLMIRLIVMTALLAGCHSYLEPVPDPCPGTPVPLLCPDTLVADTPGRVGCMADTAKGLA